MVITGNTDWIFKLVQYRNIIAQAGITKLLPARASTNGMPVSQGCSQRLCFNFSRIQGSFLEPKMKFSLV